MSIVKFYRGDPNAPKPTMGAHLGSNAIITCKGRLLLEKRRDSDVWGLVGGGVKNYETELQAMQREVKEELGIRVPQVRFRRLRSYGEPGRIAAYCDGSIWRWSSWSSLWISRRSRSCGSAMNPRSCASSPRRS